MNFKQEYKRAFSDIKADEDFKKSLVDAMKVMPKKKKKPAYIGVLAAAAIMAIVVGAGFMTGVLRGKTTQTPGTENNQMVQSNSEPLSDIPINIENNVVAQQQMSDTYVELNISGLSWYGKAENDEELLSTFVSLMCGDTLVKLYGTGEEQFDEEALMSDADTKSLLGRLQNMACTEDEYEGEDTYYKAVFEDGLTIKFWISNKGYLKLQDTETVYKIL